MNLPTLSAASALDIATRKARLRLLPFLVLMYVLAFVDRAIVGFAKNVLQADTGLSDAAFAFGAGIFFVGYALFEVPSNLLMHRFGARVWMSRIMLAWGIVSACTAFVHDAASFYLLRCCSPRGRQAGRRTPRARAAARGAISRGGRERRAAQPA